MGSWTRWLHIISFGNDGLTLYEALLAKSPHQFGAALGALLLDVAGATKLKELDSAFIESIQGDIEALVDKTFKRIGSA